MIRGTGFATIGLAALAAAALAAPAGAQYTDYQQSAGDQYQQPSEQQSQLGFRAAPRRCTSRRRFVLTVRGPHGVRRIRSARVTVGARRAPIRRRRGRLVAVVDLLGRKSGTVTVRIRGRTRSGRRFTRTRRYRTCVKRRKARRVVVGAKPARATWSDGGALSGPAALTVLGMGLLGGGAMVAAGHRARRRRRR